MSGQTTTPEEVVRMNEQDQCPVKHEPLHPTDCPIQDISSMQRKQEYYFLLLLTLPHIVRETQMLQEQFPFGLVKYLMPNDNENSGSAAIISGCDEEFLSRIQVAVSRQDYLTASYWCHHQVGQTINIATELWANKANWNEPSLARLASLVDDQRQSMFGAKAVQKRIASAMLQTLHIRASFDRFIFNFYRTQNGHAPSSQIQARLCDGSLKTAAHLTDLHLERTRQIRPAVGAESEIGGLIHRYVDDSHFYLSDERLELKADSLPDAMAGLPINTSDGRISCPGKAYVGEIWQWLGGVCDKYAYPILASS